MFERYKLRKATKGATLIEYCLIASLLSIVLIGGYRSMGNSYKNMYDKITNGLNAS